MGWHTLILYAQLFYIEHTSYIVVCTFTYIDMLKVLQDLEETSLHSVEILKHFVVSENVILCCSTSILYLILSPQ